MLGAAQKHASIIGFAAWDQVLATVRPLVSSWSVLRKHAIAATGLIAGRPLITCGGWTWVCRKAMGMISGKLSLELEL